jgi:hypothetical protein
MFELRSKGSRRSDEDGKKKLRGEIGKKPHAAEIVATGVMQERVPEPASKNRNALPPDRIDQ